MRPPKFLRHFFGWWRIFLVLGLLLPTASPLNAVARPLEIPTRKPADQTRFESVMELGRWRILYGLKTGEADIYCDGKLLIAHAVAVVKLSEPVTSRNYNTHEIFHRQIQDQFGRGMEFKVESANGTAEKMIQTFWLYEDVDYFLTEVKVSRPAGASSNFMSPLTSQTPTSFLPNGANRVLNVPFDNDKWVRYNAVPFGSNITSSEVSAFYNPASRQGLVVGSIEHGTWKTGIKSTTTSNIVNSLEIFGGLASSQTRDELPHGKISGENIKSPKIFVGLFSDWRDGLETFAHANALIAPPRPWTNGVPFGWNSWGKLQWKISPVTAREVSDFFAAELQPRGFQNDGTVYIGLDSGWNKFSDAELSEFVAHCRSNHQAAGIYFTPFAAFGDRGSNAPVASTDYKYKDLYLYANGRTQRLDGGIALDPTHPGTKHLIETTVARFKQAGFKYIKADFLTHGALEADQHFDPRVTTGLQAYNAGMKFIADTIGSEMYLNESIAPLFPAQYANSRRIACDTFGRIDETEYALNSLTYGWWLSGVLVRPKGTGMARSWKRRIMRSRSAFDFMTLISASSGAMGLRPSWLMRGWSMQAA